MAPTATVARMPRASRASGQEKADLMHAIYDRIPVAGAVIVGVRLTQAAYAHGLALALPEKVEMACSTGEGTPAFPRLARGDHGSGGAAWPGRP